MSFKEKLTDLLGGIGGILFYIISLVASVMPVVMLNLPFWIDFILIGIMLIIPIAMPIMWIIGLVGAIAGPQDALAIIYYVLFGIFAIGIIGNVLRR